MTKVTVYVTSREQQFIQGGATDAAMEFNEYVSSRVLNFIQQVDAGNIDPAILTDDEPVLHADNAFGTVDRRILIEPDIHGGDIYQRLYNCPPLDGDGNQGIEPAKVIRLACVHAVKSTWEKVNDDLMSVGLPVKRRPLSADMPEDYQPPVVDLGQEISIVNQQEIAEAQTEQEVHALFHELATKLGLLETKLLFLGQETVARELGNSRYGVHSMYATFKKNMAEDAEAAKEKAEKKRRKEILDNAASGTVGDRKEDYDTVGRR